jgi:hypothetical protein
MEGKLAPKSLLADGICVLSPRQRCSIRSALPLLPPSTWKASQRSNRCSQTGSRTGITALLTRAATTTKNASSAFGSS